MRDAEKQEFVELLSGVLELFGAKGTKASFSLWWASLKRFPLEFVRDALSGHVQDPIAGKFAPKPADIIGRLQEMDGRPGPEESWAMMPRDEAMTVVWTEEMSQAWGVALPLINEGDNVAARMAFVERYKQLVSHARAAGRAAKWTPSLGTDAMGRERALMDAVELGRLPAEHVAGLLPNRPQANVLKMIQQKYEVQNLIGSVPEEEAGQA